MAKKECMFWVAADPDQPGAAFAACADEPQYAAETAESLADWRERGATPQRVDRDTMMKMLSTWKRPGQLALDAKV
jgi:hypothetical protein